MDRDDSFMDQADLNGQSENILPHCPMTTLLFELIDKYTDPQTKLSFLYLSTFYHKFFIERTTHLKLYFMGDDFKFDDLFHPFINLRSIKLPILISDSCIETVSSLNGITKLDLRYCAISHVEWIERMKDLTDLDLGGCDLAQIDFPQNNVLRSIKIDRYLPLNGLRYCKRLTELDMFGLGYGRTDLMDGPIPATGFHLLKVCTKMSKFGIENCVFDRESIDTLMGFTTLQSLRLRQCSMKEAIISEGEFYSKLSLLNLKYIEITTTIPLGILKYKDNWGSIPILSNLHTLKVKWIEISELMSFEYLKRHTTLKRLSLRHKGSQSSRGTIESLSELINLKSFNLKCKGYDQPTMPFLAKLTNLERLILNPEVINHSTIACISKLILLKYLNIRSCDEDKISTDMDLSTLPKSLERLTIFGNRINMSEIGKLVAKSIDVFREDWSITSNGTVYYNGLPIFRDDLSIYYDPEYFRSDSEICNWCDGIIMECEMDPCTDICDGPNCENYNTRYICGLCQKTVCIYCNGFRAECDVCLEEYCNNCLQENNKVHCICDK